MFSLTVDKKINKKTYSNLSGILCLHLIRTTRQFDIFLIFLVLFELRGLQAIIFFLFLSHAQYRDLDVFYFQRTN
jgi:hypothetical protein